MNTNIRSILSTSTALGLASFTITSAFVLGAAAPATVVSFGLLAVYGMLEIAIISYQAPRLFASPPASSRSSRPHTDTPAVIRHPLARHQELARAA